MLWRWWNMTIRIGGDKRTHTVKIALYGDNGHQIDRLLLQHPLAEPVAVCALSSARTEMLHQHFPQLAVYPDLDALLKDSDAELVSLCSPVRGQQAGDAIKAMRAGKHVYAEKPAALAEEELDAILRVSRETGCRFHEMADTVFHQPFYALRKIVLAGQIGTVTQVFVQKSYPYWVAGALRPADERIDGGLTLQAGIHALRMAEHCTGLQISAIRAAEAKTAERTNACAMLFRYRSGAVGSAVVNYCNPPAFESWGNDSIRIFGTKGMAEITDNGRSTHLYTQQGDLGALPDLPAPGFMDAYLQQILFGEEMPITLEEELHPLRMVLRAKKALLGQTESC